MIENASEIVGTTIGHYRVEAQLGVGGMGEVYRAEDTRLGRQVALKFLPPAMRDDPERRARLRREAQAAARLHAPSIAATHDLAEVDGALFIVMEYVAGETLARRLERGPLPLPRAVRLAMQVADGLDEAHGLGILHRDIKSANLMLTERGHIKVLDFGLTKFLGNLDDGHRATSAITLDEPTVAGALLGTVSYMSPEQALGHPLDQRSDLFSLGIVMYEMVASKLPFSGDTALAISNSILHSPPPPLAHGHGEASVAYERIVSKCLQKSPAARYQAARELHHDLRQLERGLEATAYVESTTPPSLEGTSLAGTVAMAPSSYATSASVMASRVVAVMPFNNITRQEADDWIGTGIAETVTASNRENRRSGSSPGSIQESPPGDRGTVPRKDRRSMS